MYKMFCYQCQETASGTGCTTFGVCGKTDEVADLQDRLVYATGALCALTTRMREEGKTIPCDMNRFITMNLFMTITNADFDPEDFRRRIKDTLLMHSGLIGRLDTGDTLPSKVFISTGSDPTSTDLLDDAKTSILDTNPEVIRSLHSVITLGIKGLAAYLTHAAALGYEDEKIDVFIQKTLGDIFMDNISKGGLLKLIIETGRWGVEGMALLDKANTETYGHPEPTNVPLSVVQDEPGILVSGHDLKILKELLDQTEGKGISVYTHGEMLPAHAYPALKDYRHLRANYGGAWWEQKKQFESFNGPIILTSNCLVPPRETYIDRVYTIDPVGFPGCHKLESNCAGHIDFTKVIDHARKCFPPSQLGTDQHGTGQLDNGQHDPGAITIGYAHDQLEALIPDLIGGVRSGDISEFVVMAGCDGRMASRRYYADFAQNLPKTSVILTAGCAKYRYNKLNLGEIVLPSGRTIPRVLDAGQCNDSYSLALLALKLRDALKQNSVNDLPIRYNIAWYEQKAVIVLLALLSLGVKNIHLGPTLPAFISPDVLDYLKVQYNLSEKI